MIETTVVDTALWLFGFYLSGISVVTGHNLTEDKSVCAQHLFWNILNQIFHL